VSQGSLATVYTEVLGFEVPEALPAGADVTVRLLLRNANNITGYVQYVINGNPDNPDRFITVEAGSSYPNAVPPGESVWLEVPIRYFKMPNWDFVLTARNYEGTTKITKKIKLQTGTPTALTIKAPLNVGVGVPFTVSGRLTFREGGVDYPLQGRTINLSYNGVSLGSTTTGADGTYSITVSIPQPGTYTLKAVYAGESGISSAQASWKLQTVSTNLIPVLIPLAVGTALIYFTRTM